MLQIQQKLKISADTNPKYLQIQTQISADVADTTNIQNICRYKTQISADTADVADTTKLETPWGWAPVKNKVKVKK